MDELTARPAARRSSPFYDRGSGTFGPDYSVPRDGPRIELQQERIREYMRLAGWRTLEEIEVATGDPQSSISAQLRHLRKPKFGGWIVDKRIRSEGTWEYRLTAPVIVEASGQARLL